MAESFIYSLLDKYTYMPRELHEFIDIGAAPLGAHHIMIFFRYPKNREILLSIEYDDPVHLVNGCVLYKLTIDKVLYGYLIVVHEDMYRMTEKTLFVGDDSVEHTDFELQPFASDKTQTYIFKSGDNVLITQGVPLSNPFIISDI